MGIEANFNMNDVNAKIANFLKGVDRTVIERFNRLGEELVKYAKIQHASSGHPENYLDQSGNLTSSMGYVVVKDREVVYSSGFETHPPSAEWLRKNKNRMIELNGKQVGADFAAELAKQITQTYALIIVAGMNYAAYVEDMGYNVLIPAELKSKTDFPAMMNEMVDEVNKKANKFSSSIGL
jgi:hypothetical protein